MAQLTLGLAQMYPLVGNVEKNLQTHLNMIEQAAEQNVQLVVFPELSLTGYNVRDLVPMVARSIESETIQTLCEASRQHEIDVMAGFVHETSRHEYFIAAAYFSRGEILHIHHKIYPPTYGIFDEGRFFGAGEHIRAFNTPFGRVGMLICEDFWHASPAYVLWVDGADMLLMQSASPARGVDREKIETSYWVNGVLKTYSSVFTNYVVHCNRVGFEDGEVFWGGSAIYDPRGRLVIEAPHYDQTLTVQTIDLGQIRRTRSRLPLLRDERPDLTARELNRILSATPQK